MSEIQSIIRLTFFFSFFYQLFDFVVPEFKILVLQWSVRTFIFIGDKGSQIRRITFAKRIIQF